MVVNIFVTQRQSVNALRQHLGNCVLHQYLAPAIEKTFRQTRQKIHPLVGLAQKKGTRVGTDRTAVETSYNLAPPVSFKSKAELVTLCHSEGRLLFGANCCVETQLCHEERPFAYCV